MSKALKNKIKLNDVVSVKDFGALGAVREDGRGDVLRTVCVAFIAARLPQ